MNEQQACQNNDKEIWRRRPGDFYSPSMHVTEGGGIGINCHGHVIVAPLERWHEAGDVMFTINPDVPSWKWKLAMWLLGRKDITVDKQ